VGKTGSGTVENFTRTMRELCADMNIPLADNCPQNDKAFECQQRGTVLGVGFDSRNMTWFLGKDKADKVVKRCMDSRRAMHMDLNQMQKLMGTVNDIAQMCPLMTCHKMTGNAFLRSFEGKENLLKPVPEDMKEDMKVIAKMADTARVGLPIAKEPSKPNLAAIVFYTDAAGASYTKVQGKKVFHDCSGRGVACLGGENLEDMWIWTRVLWTERFMLHSTDEKGCSFGCKSTTLESVGVLLPLVAFPEKVRGRNIVFRIDNMAVMFGWRSGRVKNDKTATGILKTAKYMAAYLGTTIFIEHVPRVSNEMTDELSKREVPKNSKIATQVDRTEYKPVEGYLNMWQDDPQDTEKLCNRLMRELKEKFPM